MRYDLSRLRRSVRQERQIARDTGGRRTAGSGNQPGHKGDVRAGHGWLVEAKTTLAVRYTLRLSDWRKIEREALQARKTPAMQIEVAGRMLVVVSYDDWLSRLAD